mgnify:CR=1 FL=1
MNFRTETITKFKGYTESQIKYTIMEAMHHKDEDLLSSLGVLFELVWKDANPMERKQIIKIIKHNL